MIFTRKFYLKKMLILSPLFDFTQLANAESLITTDFTFAKRIESYGDESVGYPQVCIRTNMPDQRIDMQGIFYELSAKYEPSMLINEATKLAGSGRLGHVWTIFFDSPTSWRSWSFRRPDNAFGDALYISNENDGPKRAFNYQYCVSTKGIDTSTETITHTYVQPLVQESQDIAKQIFIWPFDFQGGVYTPFTPCVWFATKLFNKVTGLDIPFEQKFDWETVSKLTNDPIYKSFQTTVDAGVVAEAISKKIKFSISYEDESALFTNNNSYQYSYLNKFVNEKPVKFNSYLSKIADNYNNYKAAFRLGEGVFLLDYQGKVSLLDRSSNGFLYESHPFEEVFGNVDFDPKMVRSIMPITKNMPEYIDEYTHQYLLFLENGGTYLMSNFVLTKTNYFEQYAPHLLPYVSRVLATTSFNDESIYVFLTGRKYIEVRISDFAIIDGEKSLDQHPELGKTFKLQ
ncbi:hypothetical protein DYB13_17650 [Vibrio cholerae]|nr:hypothetical protein [Vibrio cholerae]EGR2476088.1 hypothetical protein [Vibrio cholerae]